MAKLGYARVAARNDALDEQVEVLEEYGCDKLFSDDRTTNNIERSGLKAMLDYAREGDIVVVMKLDRLARSIQDLQSITDELKERGIDLISLTQNIDTASENGESVFNWIDIFADFEREVHSERIRSGIDNAREKGVKLGRSEMNIDLKEKAYEMYCTGDYTMRDIVIETGLSRATVYRYIEKKKASEKMV
ncbi:recombinase family protein [Bacillus sp. Marseille-Q3570]|uniref:recombinase family protein n=1 Tax=Bacillus sp. Marseille-Q3570 TaxID=2963522 RepID=UPI0021B70ECC|nr:recombinase family protein [Bacillus sp. Marseille-Q3570]